MRHRINVALAIDHVNRNMIIIYGNTLAKCEIIHRITHAALLLGNESCFEPPPPPPTHWPVCNITGSSDSVNVAGYLPSCGLKDHAGPIDHLAAVPSSPERDSRQLNIECHRAFTLTIACSEIFSRQNSQFPPSLHGEERHVKNKEKGLAVSHRFPAFARRSLCNAADTRLTFASLVNISAPTMRNDSLLQHFVDETRRFALLREVSSSRKE